ncbi:hypothetical protein [Pseudomonas sp. DE0157]|uniref:hypothetical protein n=1 Tax=Pseudomonas sp. DE0157 TaxID=2584952 RepID=UPI0011A1C0F6|nr:hypothetical protein [Pseudomonas sp. DE0157]
MPPSITDPAYQRDLSAVSAARREAGILSAQRRMTFDADGATGYSVGQYIISLASVAGPVIGVAVGAWITARWGRKLRIKVGDIEPEAPSPAEIENLVAQAIALKAQLAEQNSG